jgi:hypothetical protein
MKRPLIASPPWTTEDEQRLRVLLISGEHPAMIGKQLQRSEVAIRQRMTKLGVRPKRGIVRLSPSARMQALRDTVSAGAKINREET